MAPQLFEALPEPTKAGSEIFSSLAPHLGEKREKQLYDLASCGNIPMFLRQWKEIPVSSGMLTGTVYVLPDYFCVGTDDDYLYAPMGALGAEKVGELFNARLPTKKLVQAMYDHGHKQVAQPWGPPYDGSMSDTDRWPTQTKKVRERMARSGAVPGDLVEGHFKSIIVSKRTMEGEGKMLGFWGWFASNGKPIQGDSQAHGAGYCDYAHGAHYIMNEMIVGEDVMSIDDVLRHRDYFRLISDEQITPYTTYASVRKAHGVVTLLY